MIMNIVIMGVQGSGKGTQSRLLTERLTIPHISTGDLFRENINNQTAMGKEAQAFTDRGALVPDVIVINMVRDRLKSPDTATGFILDGFPRNGLQMAALEFLRPVEHAILLELDDATAIGRLSVRTVCLRCGIIYGSNRPPKVVGICDECGGPLVERNDDKDRGAIMKRLELYHQEIDIMLRYYEWKGVLRHIPADGTPDSIFSLCLQALGVS
jgi:adenylate kinase